MNIAFSWWYFKQKLQYYFGDISLVLSSKNKYTAEDFRFWRKRNLKSKNKDKNFYVIRRRSGRHCLKGSTTMGICGMLLFNLGDIDYALKHNKIPVIDMQSYANTYLAKDCVGKFNAWDYFFKQEYKYDIDELLQKGQVTISDGILISSMLSYDILMQNDYENLNIEKWRYLAQNYASVNDKIVAQADEFLKKYSGEKILGVLCRGTDFTNLHPHNHPVQPDLQEVIEKVKDTVNKFDCDRIYLATEDKEIYSRFYEVFGEKVITYQKPDIEYKGGYFAGNISNNEKLKNGSDYLTSIMILSKCNCLVAGIASGTIAALLYANNYEYVYYWRLGYYE